MFENLTNKFEEVFSSLKKAPSLDEKQVDEGLRNIRQALLEADVSLSVAKEFVNKVKPKALGQEIIRSTSPGQMVIKIVHDELIQLLGESNAEINLNSVPPVPIMLVGLQGFGETPTYQLSGGMQQRVALARCLINDPELILMDEPLGALDALTREKMQSLVLKIWKETGKTIILITHSVEEALLLGERLYVMAPRPGRIHKEYKLPFASMGLNGDLREIKNDKEFVSKREEILTMIWDMEEEIMGKEI